MSLKSGQFSEVLFQHLWAEHFFWRELKSSDGKAVRIIDPGVQNQTDGPDFLEAKVQIEDLILCGAIELHLTGKDWYHHNHHFDVNYDSVILHVTLDENPPEVINSKGYTLPTVSVFESLPVWPLVF